MVCGIILNLPWRAEDAIAACIQVRSLIKCLGKIVASVIDEGCLWVLGGGLGDPIVLSYRRGRLGCKWRCHGSGPVFGVCVGYGPVEDRDYFLGTFGGCVEVVIASVWWVHGSE